MWVSPGLGVNFEDAKSIALGINEVSLPAGAGHGKFWQCNFAAMVGYSLSHCVKVFYLH